MAPRQPAAAAAPPPPAAEPVAAPAAPPLAPPRIQPPTPPATGAAAGAAGTDSAPAPADDGLAEERAKAERLARIIVSDIVLYNQEKFEAAVAGGGDVVAAMQDELAEGRALFRERIDARVREERDHLAEELVRVARSRGGR